MFFQFSVVQVLVGIRKQFINNLLCPLGPLLLVLTIIIIIIITIIPVFSRYREFHSYRLISVLPLIWSTIMKFYITSFLWVLEVIYVNIDTVSIKSITRYGGLLLQ